MRTPRALYEKALSEGHLDPDTGQAAALEALGTLHAQLTAPGFLFWRPRAPAGLYLYGAVGRGKSMLVDLFCAALPDSVAWKRVHFHAFMADVHAALHARRAATPADNASLLPALAREVADTARVLCLDEFHVRDIADALILARLVEGLWAAGVALVTTSNEAPEELYKGGLQRDLFAPFVALIRTQMRVMSLDGDRDHRQSGGAPGPGYFCPLTTRGAARALFESLGTPAPGILPLPGGRGLALEVTAEAAWSKFTDLCERPLGAADYLALARAYPTVFIEGVPRMGYDRRNEALRFVHLVDVLYDEGARVAILAATAPEGLYTGHEVPFARTASRLAELARQGWG